MADASLVRLLQRLLDGSPDDHQIQRSLYAATEELALDPAYGPQGTDVREARRRLGRSADLAPDVVAALELAGVRESYPTPEAATDPLVELLHHISRTGAVDADELDEALAGSSVGLRRAMLAEIDLMSRLPAEVVLAILRTEKTASKPQYDLTLADPRIATTIVADPETYQLGHRFAAAACSDVPTEQVIALVDELHQFVLSTGHTLGKGMRRRVARLHDAHPGLPETTVSRLALVYCHRFGSGEDMLDWVATAPLTEDGVTRAILVDRLLSTAPTPRNGHHLSTLWAQLDAEEQTEFALRVLRHKSVTDEASAQALAAHVATMTATHPAAVERALISDLGTKPRERFRPWMLDYPQLLTRHLVTAEHPAWDQVVDLLDEDRLDVVVATCIDALADSGWERNAFRARMAQIDEHRTLTGADLARLRPDWLLALLDSEDGLERWGSRCRQALDGIAGADLAETRSRVSTLHHLLPRPLGEAIETALAVNLA